MKKKEYLKTRVIDLTSNNVTTKEDVRVVFEDRDKSQLFGPATQCVQVPGTRTFKEVTKFEARDWREIGFTGLVDERLVIIADPNDEESLDKLIGLENFIGFWYHVLFRLTGDFSDKNPSVSLVFTDLPYEWKDNIPTAKSNKIAACLRWKNRLNGYVDIKIVSRGEWSACLTNEEYRLKSPCHSFLGFNVVGSPIQVDTTMTSFYETSVRTTVHAMNPISDILYDDVKHELLKDVGAIWVSPTIETILGIELEDMFQNYKVIKSDKDVKDLIYKRDMKFFMKVKHENGTVDPQPSVDSLKVKKIAVFAVSLRDFMTFEQEIVMAVSNMTDSSDPIELDLFVNYTPEAATDQSLYEIENNLMNFIEDRSPLINPVFCISDMDAAKLADVPSKLLKYIPKNIKIYHTKILDTIC